LVAQMAHEIASHQFIMFIILWVNYIFWLLKCLMYNWLSSKKREMCMFKRPKRVEIALPEKIGNPKLFCREERRIGCHSLLFFD
jgi:hypothetical protein